LNLSLLAGVNGPEVLPPAEIRFDAYPPGKVRVVGYRSKWEEGSFEFNHTPRSFEFLPSDASLIAHLKELALKCWRLFNLRGYARVDFRVDPEGRPWILEVNANPCLSPDAGFSAATLRAGMTFPEVLKRIIGDLPHA
jgi:D-alanine-D-alanine ligase